MNATARRLKALNLMHELAAIPLGVFAWEGHLVVTPDSNLTPAEVQMIGEFAGECLIAIEEGGYRPLVAFQELELEEWFWGLTAALQACFLYLFRTSMQRGGDAAQAQRHAYRIMTAPEPDQAEATEEGLCHG